MKLHISRLLLSLGILIAAIPAGAEEIEPFYRVEVLVFLHTDGRSDARHSDEIEDYTALLDPVERALETGDESDPEGDGDPADEELNATLELIDTLDRLESDLLMPKIPTWPEPFIALDELSDPMTDARRRLENSSRYELVTSRAWHQPLSPERPPTRVRIHDRNVLEADWIRMTPAGIPALEALDDGEVEALKPAFHYRLDGGIRLRQRQFMHLDVDLQWRGPALPAPMNPLTDTPPADGFEIHQLQESRTVQPGRLEYFDSSWLGVLVLISELEPLDGSEIDPEETEEQDVIDGDIDAGR